MPDVVLRERDQNYGVNDVKSFPVTIKPIIDTRVFARDESRGINDVVMRIGFGTATGIGAASFPTQLESLRIWNGGMLELCLVALGDAPSGMGGQLRIKRPADIAAVYLVETSDPHASPVRIQTTTGIKAARLKT